MSITSFKRIEKKYVVTKEQKEILLREMLKHMELDKYCLNEKTYKVQNVYYDTVGHDLIAQSVRKPAFKQKLRVRKYTNQKDRFLEIKKKCEGVVGKRRVALSQEEIDDFILRQITPIRANFVDNEVIKEIAYVLSLYKVRPEVYISYERLGLFDINDKEFRITFDEKIHAKKNNFDWDQDDYEINLLEDGYFVMEIKTVKNFPLWLVKLLNENKIYPHSFSKYGTEYELGLKNGGK